jgi:bifunctional non-homologous end joining protein LigD
VKKTAAKKASKKSITKKAAEPAAEKKPVSKESELAFGKIKVRVSNLSKIFWPDEKFTKGDVIQYYQSVSKYILPYLKDRPESLKRNPNGIKEFGFFHKDAGVEAPAWVKSKKLFSESTSKDVNYILCNDAATLAYLNNLGCIEINPWHSTIQKLDNPDYLIIDLDPSDKNTFEQVIEAANVTRDVLKQADAECYCKTSGATGMHIYVPAQKKYTYDQLKDFAHLVCMLVQNQLPEFTSLERNLKKRGNKMIYLDHLQNRRGQTISSVYSLRPKEGATVSMPLKWAEVKPGLSPQNFNISNALRRIEKMGDLFAPVLGKGIDLVKCLKLLDK